VEKWDPIEDDHLAVVNLKGKGWSSCRDAPILASSTPCFMPARSQALKRYMRSWGGSISLVPFFEPIIGRTTDELKKDQSGLYRSDPLHGPEGHLLYGKGNGGSIHLNMSGTKLTFCSIAILHRLIKWFTDMSRRRG